MILGAEIALIILGIYALIKGKITLSKTRIVEGPMARVLGALALVPLPAAFAISALYLAIVAMNGKPIKPEEHRWMLTIIEVIIVILTIVLIYTIGLAIGRPPRVRKRSLKKRIVEEDDLEPV